MDGKLYVLAEIAVALAGFSSVIVAFRRHGTMTTWQPLDAYRFRIMLEAGLAAALFAILPGAIEGLGVAPKYHWRLLSALMLLYLVFDVWRRGRLSRGLSLNPTLTIIILTGILAATVIQVLNVADWLVRSGSGPYVFGVSWLTVNSGLMFYLLVSRSMDAPDDSDSPAS